MRIRRSNLPIAVPSKIVCVGLNYRDHADESAMDIPAQPLLFAKWENALVGHGNYIRLPTFVKKADYEAELAVVIGHTALNISVDDALDVVAGYLCLNDVSARDIQFLDGQWTRGKSFDTFCPIGPRLIPVSEVPDPQSLRVRCSVNGEIVQDDTTASMIFSIREIISFASRSLRLEAGDIIATGTPAGVQFGRETPHWLEHGDVVTVEIEGIGTLTNPVERIGSEAASLREDDLEVGID